MSAKKSLKIEDEVVVPVEVTKEIKEIIEPIAVEDEESDDDIPNNGSDLDIEEDAIDPGDGHYYMVDISLMKDGENEEEFLVRAKAEKLGKWEEIPQVPGPIPLDTNKMTFDLIYRLRLELDLAIKMASTTLGGNSDCSKSIFYAKAWLGRMLGHLGTENPYHTEKRITSANEIPPTAEENNDWEALRKHTLKDKLEQVLDLRDRLSGTIEDLNNIELRGFKLEDPRLVAIALTQSYVNMNEAKFDLGNELSIIRNGN